MENAKMKRKKIFPIVLKQVNLLELSSHLLQNNDFSMISTKINRMMNIVNRVHGLFSKNELDLSKKLRISCSIPNIDRLVSNLHLSEQITVKPFV